MNGTGEERPGLELACRRLALGLSQADLATLLDVKQVVVSRWESEKEDIPLGVGLVLEHWEDVLGDLSAQVVSGAFEQLNVEDDGEGEGLLYDATVALTLAKPLADPLRRIAMVALAHAAHSLREEHGAEVYLTEAKIGDGEGTVKNVVGVAASYN